MKNTFYPILNGLTHYVQPLLSFFFKGAFVLVYATPTHFFFIFLTTIGLFGNTKTNRII